MSTKRVKKTTLDNKIPNNNIQNTDQPQVNHKEDKDSEKYKIALKFINVILVNIGKEEVDDLVKFCGIDREDIIKEVNKKSFEEMEDELFKHFDKVKCGWYRRKVTKNYILTFLRCMCDILGLSFSYTEHKKQINKTVTSIMLYSIN